MYKHDSLLANNEIDTTRTRIFEHWKGRRNYELSNHLGNVMVVVTDRKVQHTSNSTDVDYFEAEVVSETDYYAFGSEMVGRTVTPSAYEHGFNGQLKDDEALGGGNLNTALFWEYDTRLGRRWNLDRIPKAWLSQYATFSNSPLWRKDPLGDDDFFNSDGSFAYSTKTGTAIIIINAKKEQQSFSDFTKNSVNNNAAAKIVSYYSAQIGINSNLVKTVGVSPHSDDLGVSSKDNISIGTKGGASKFLNDYNNLKDVLDHEKDHHLAGDPIIKQYSYEEHLAIYSKQMDNASLFEKTTNEFKAGIANNYASYLLGALNSNEIDYDKFNGLISSFNKKYAKYNLSITGEYSTGGIKMTTFGLNNKGQTVETPVKARNDPH